MNRLETLIEKKKLDLDVCLRIIMLMMRYCGKDPSSDYENISGANIQFVPISYRISAHR